MSYIHIDKSTKSDNTSYTTTTSKTNNDMNKSSSPRTSTNTTNTNNKSNKDKTNKKARFVWPPELHREFISAVFDVGLSYASVDALEDLNNNTLPITLTVEQINAQIARYRLFRCQTPSLTYTDTDPTSHTHTYTTPYTTTHSTTGNVPMMNNLQKSTLLDHQSTTSSTSSKNIVTLQTMSTTHHPTHTRTHNTSNHIYNTNNNIHNMSYNNLTGNPPETNNIILHQLCDELRARKLSIMKQLETYSHLKYNIENDILIYNNSLGALGQLDPTGGTSAEFSMLNTHIDSYFIHTGTDNDALYASGGIHGGGSGVGEGMYAHIPPVLAGVTSNDSAIETGLTESSYSLRPPFASSSSAHHMLPPHPFGGQGSGGPGGTGGGTSTTDVRTELQAMSSEMRSHMSMHRQLMMRREGQLSLHNPYNTHTTNHTTGGVVSEQHADLSVTYENSPSEGVRPKRSRNPEKSVATTKSPRTSRSTIPPAGPSFTAMLIAERQLKAGLLSPTSPSPILSSSVQPMTGPPGTGTLGGTTAGAHGVLTREQAIGDPLYQSNNNYIYHNNNSSSSGSYHDQTHPYYYSHQHPYEPYHTHDPQHQPHPDQHDPHNTHQPLPHRYADHPLLSSDPLHFTDPLHHPSHHLNSEVERGRADSGLDGDFLIISPNNGHNHGHSFDLTHTHHHNSYSSSGGGHNYNPSIHHPHQQHQQQHIHDSSDAFGASFDIDDELFSFLLDPAPPSSTSSPGQEAREREGDTPTHPTTHPLQGDEAPDLTKT